MKTESLSLAPIFSNDMIVQQQKPLIIWGGAAPGNSVTVRLAGRETTAMTDNHGIWRAELPPVTADGESHTLCVMSEGERLECKNVLIGEVWLCWALGTTYGKDGVYSGPLMISKTITGDKLTVSFEHIESGLITRDSKAVTGFEIAGSDGDFCKATAAIEGETVVLHSEDVPYPQKTRYAWAEDPEFNLYNAEGFPAAPFTAE